MTSFPLLDGRTALITGSGAGLGLATAEALANAGANVVVAVRRREAGEAAVASISRFGGRAVSVVAGAQSLAEMQAGVARAVEMFGGLDIAIHNANNSASAMPLALEDVTDAQWQEQSEVAHRGTFVLAKACYPHLKRSPHARFIVLGSAFGLHGAGFNPVYATLKGGIRGFVKALAREWGPDGIRVLSVAPSAKTPATEEFFNSYPEVRDRYLANFPLGRMGDPRDDVGAAFVAICSDHFRYVTGQTLMVDGGLFTA